MSISGTGDGEMHINKREKGFGLLNISVGSSNKILFSLETDLVQSGKRCSGELGKRVFESPQSHSPVFVGSSLAQSLSLRGSPLGSSRHVANSVDLAQHVFRRTASGCVENMAGNGMSFHGVR